MTQTTVSPDLLQSLEVLTKLVVQDIGHHLNVVIVIMLLSYLENIWKLDNTQQFTS